MVWYGPKCVITNPFKRHFIFETQIKFIRISIHSEKCWVVSTQIWVKYGQTQMLG